MKVPVDFRIDFRKPARMTHLLTTEMSLPLDIQTVFAFFSDASNLERITPQELRFHILTPDPIQMAEGTPIDYRLRLFGFPIVWKTMISAWSPPHQFVDEQIKGPYRLWVHTHRFVEEGGITTIHDTVIYRLPHRPFGEIFHPLIKAQLRRIFCFRKGAIEANLLSTAGSPCN